MHACRSTLEDPTGQRVAVGATGFQANMVLLIAAENLGAVTVSFQPANDMDAEFVFRHVDWVLSDLPQEVPPPARLVPVDDAFVRQVMAADPAQPLACPRIALELHEPQRISRTSGSSGRSKFMVLSRKAQEQWVRSGMEVGNYRADSRVMIAGPLVINAIYSRSCSCLRIGAAVIELGGGNLATQEITHWFSLPALLQDVLDTAPAGFAPRRPIDVGTVGGFLSGPLREQAARVFGGRVANRYGANEVYSICDEIDATGCGALSAGVDLRILDEAGRELPHGQLGVIAVRTAAMVEGYLDDEESTRRHFHDGWFVSGDWGTLVGHRVLRLAGRHDDLLNIGGIKVPASAIEAQVNALAGADCVALAVNLDDGAVTMGLAIADAGGMDREAMRRKVAAELNAGAVMGVKVIFVARIPHMANGKVDRVALHRLLEATPAANL